MHFFRFSPGPDNVLLPGTHLLSTITQSQILNSAENNTSTIGPACPSLLAPEASEGQGLPPVVSSLLPAFPDATDLAGTQTAMDDFMSTSNFAITGNLADLKPLDVTPGLPQSPSQPVIGVVPTVIPQLEQTVTNNIPVVPVVPVVPDFAEQVLAALGGVENLFTLSEPDTQFARKLKPKRKTNKTSARTSRASHGGRPGGLGTQGLPNHLHNRHSTNSLNDTSNRRCHQQLYPELVNGPETFSQSLDIGCLRRSGDGDLLHNDKFLGELDTNDNNNIASAIETQAPEYLVADPHQRESSSNRGSPLVADSKGGPFQLGNECPDNSVNIVDDCNNAVNINR